MLEIEVDFKVDMDGLTSHCVDMDRSTSRSIWTGQLQGTI